MNNGAQDCSPGPIYQTSSSKLFTKSTPTLLRNTSRRAKINEGVQTTPSPTHYDPKKIDSSVYQAVGFAKSQRMDDERNNQNPEPNKYEVNPKPGTTAYTLTARPFSYFDDMGVNPGPAHYRIKTSMGHGSRADNSIYRTSQRFFVADQGRPGPGHYRVKSKKEKFQHQTKTSTMGKSKRMPNQKNLPPAPGHYKISRELTSKNKLGCSSLSGRNIQGQFNGNSETSEAFGNYFVEPEKIKKSHSQTTSRAKRQIFKVVQTPGPSDYFPQKTMKIKQNNHAKIPTAKNEPYNDSPGKPGPAHYYIHNKETKVNKNTTFNKSNSVSHLNPILHVNSNPGVGAYSIKKQVKTNNGMLIGKSQRIDFTSSNSTGVGDYELMIKQSRGGSFSRSARFHKNAVPTRPQ